MLEQAQRNDTLLEQADINYYDFQIALDTHRSQVYRYAETDDAGRACRHGSREGRGHIPHSPDTSTASRRSRSVRNQRSVHWVDAHLDDVKLS